MADNYEQYAAEAKENADDGEQRRPGAMNRQGEEQRPDRRSRVDHCSDVAGHGAFAPGEECERDSIIEEGNGQEPGKKAARR